MSAGDICSSSGGSVSACPCGRYKIVIRMAVRNDATANTRDKKGEEEEESNGEKKKKIITAGIVRVNLTAMQHKLYRNTGKRCIS